VIAFSSKPYRLSDSHSRRSKTSKYSSTELELEFRNAQTIVGSQMSYQVAEYNQTRAYESSDLGDYMKYLEVSETRYGPVDKKRLELFELQGAYREPRCCASLPTIRTGLLPRVWPVRCAAGN